MPKTPQELFKGLLTVADVKLKRSPRKRPRTLILARVLPGSTILNA